LDCIDDARAQFKMVSALSLHTALFRQDGKDISWKGGKERGCYFLFLSLIRLQAVLRRQMQEWESNEVLSLVALDDMLVQMENHLSQGRRSLGQMAMNQWIVAQLWSTNSASVIRAQIQKYGMMMI